MLASNIEYKTERHDGRRVDIIVAETDNEVITARRKSLRDDDFIEVIRTEVYDLICAMNAEVVTHVRQVSHPGADDTRPNRPFEITLLLASLIADLKNELIVCELTDEDKADAPIYERLGFICRYYKSRPVMIYKRKDLDAWNA